MGMPKDPQTDDGRPSWDIQSELFGPLNVPDGASRAAEIEELSRRAYRSAWHSFETRCRSLGREPLAADPGTLAMYRECRCN
jgi:hypothetical protein